MSNRTLANRVEPRLFPVSSAAAAPEAPTVKASDLVSNVNATAFSQTFAALGGYPSNTGVPVTELTALQAGAVYGCTRCISEDVSALSIIVRKRLSKGGWNVIYDHPLVRLFEEPNAWQSSFDFMAFVCTCWCLRGNAYVVINRDDDGTPISLVPVHPDRVTVTLSDKGFLWYRVNSRHVGYGVMIPPDDMIHLKNISLDSYVGLSPIAAAQDVIGLALATQQHGAVLFRQGGQAGGVLTFPGRIGKQGVDNIAQSWRDTHAGVQNAHKVVVLEEGGKFEKVGMTSEDAQFLQTRQFQVVDICARIYRVPPHKVGELGRATFSNIEQLQQQYIDDALKPVTERLQRLMTAQLLFEDERRTGMQVFYDYSSMLTGDQTTRFGAYQIALLNGFMNRNEVRSRESMNPVEGGDEYRVPLNTGDPTHPETLGQNKPPADTGDDNADPDAA